MDGRTDVRNFSPFYRTLSPVGAAAQKVMDIGQSDSLGLLETKLGNNGQFRWCFLSFWGSDEAPGVTTGGNGLVGRGCGQRMQWMVYLANFEPLGLDFTLGK